MRTQAHQYGRFAAIFGRAERALARLEAAPEAPARAQSERALIGELGPIVLPKG